MRERELIKRFEGMQIRFDEPNFTELVQLPKVVESMDTFWDKHDILLGMHTDMLGALVDALGSFRDQTRENLYIQGRVLTDDQNWKLRSSPLWSFFWEGRAYRAEGYNQRAVARYIFPKDTRLTEEDVRKYEKMVFSPETTQKKLRHKVGWFNAQSILDSPSYSRYGPNSLQSILGACNQFKVGSDTLSPRILQLVRGRFIEYFRDKHMIVKIDKRWLEETKLELVSRIFRI